MNADPSRYDAAVIGAGPAGLAAATLLAGHGARAVLIDEQPDPGGQIHRGVERAGPAVRRIMGPDYGRGARLAAAFRASGAVAHFGSAVWQVTRDREIWLTRGGRSQRLTASAVIVATGAMERPVPIAGWTLPGAMAAGAVQILLKSGFVARDIVLAGSGPLLYLLAAQLIDAGAPPRALVDTTRRGALRAAARHLPRALACGGAGYLGRGIMLASQLRAHGVAVHRHAADLRLIGEAAVREIRFRCAGAEETIPARLVALHEGVIPGQQMTRAIGCDHVWDDAQHCFRPRTDGWGNTSVDGVLAAGDGAGIGGARAAESAGRLAALEALRRIGRIDAARRDALAAADRRALARHLAIRPLLDALYAPPAAVTRPADGVIVCRCEEVTAGAIRGAVAQGCQGPNQAKSFLRVGMGPCQGRMCGPVVADIIAGARGVSVPDAGYFRVRAPLRPVTVGELAGLEP
jgi:NADPH-dependent 2,4-dienoyl-CoA reductase/sulfur reductase-like enzyme